MSAPDEIPLARPDLGRARGGARARGSALRPALAGAGPGALRATTSPHWLGVDDAVAVSSGTAALHLGSGASAGARATRSSPRRSASSPRRTACCTRALTPVFCGRRPGHAQPRPGRGAQAAVGERTVGILPVRHLRLPGRDARASRQSRTDAGSACSRTPARRSARWTPRASRRRPRQPGDLRLLREQAADDGGGRHRSSPRPADEAAALRSERNQGRAVDMGWLDHDRLGFNYRLTELQAALGVAQLERADELLAERARVAAALRRARSAQLGGRPAGEGPADGPGPSLRRPRLRAAVVVRLHRAAAGRRPIARPSSPTSTSAGSRRRRTCRAST